MKTIYDHYVFVGNFYIDFIFLLLYVDDMHIISKYILQIYRLKKHLGEFFAVKDMRETKQILGIRIMHEKKEKKFYITLEQYIKRVLHRFKMENSYMISTPPITHFKLSYKQNPSSEDKKK